MPRYQYRCEKCEADFEYYHTISEKKTICEVCNEQTLLKVPSFSGIVKKEEKEKVGAVVDNYIEEAREEIRREKQKLKKVEYKPE